jgi:threonine dehydratase
MIGLVEIVEIEAARERIRGRVRHTPVLRPAPVPGVPAGLDLTLKLECLQVTGSFKARGATNKRPGRAPAP